jgi:hypothetical protein
MPDSATGFAREARPAKTLEVVGARTSFAPSGTQPASRRLLPRLAERGGWLLFLLMLLFLSFVGGAMVVQSGVFPAEFLRNAWKAADALRIRREILSDPLRTNLWQPARSPRRGVIVHDPLRAQQGYTLYTSGDGAVARLIDMDGLVLHEWRRPYSTVWHPGAAVQHPQPDPVVYMDKARLLPNGDLLAIYISSADTPWGYGMVKLDAWSNIKWTWLGHTHHDFSIAPDGRIYVLAHRFNFDRRVIDPPLETPHLEDMVVVLDPEGRELRRISLTGALLHSQYNFLPRVLPHFSLTDPLHTNTVFYIDAAAARNFPFGQEGDLLVSFRDAALIAVVSPVTERIKWAARGSWIGQHDPSIVANGDILLFDNFGGLRGANSSRVIQFDPRTLQIHWRFAGDAKRRFHSDIRSNAQRLANGNTLITESDAGRILEVAPDGDVVWEYLNPIRRGRDKSLIAVISAARRIDPASLDPEFRKMIEQR